jgi:signal transduction histidine kinase
MSKILSKLLPDSFKNRFLALFILFAVITGAVSTSIQYYYDKNVYHSYAAETIMNIHNSMEERIRDAILYNDIYALFSTAGSITNSVSVIRNVFIVDPLSRYITDALVSKSYQETLAENALTFEIILENGKPVGSVIYIIDTDEISKTVLAHSLTSLFIILPIIILFIFLSIRLILYFTKPLNSISEQLKKTDISTLPTTFTLPDYTSVEVRNLADVFDTLSRELDKNIKMNIEQEKNLAKEERLAAIGSMSAGLAHELRNPAMSLQMLMHGISNSANSLDSKDLEVMNREVSRITSTVNEFLQIAKTVETNSALTSTIKIKEMLLEHVQRVIKGIITLIFSGDDYEFSSDEMLIFNTLVNLINNSYEAGATKIEITFYKIENQVTITFHDNGTGIPDGIIDKIFRPFYTTKKSGTGLGMSMCEKMISALDGSIAVDTDCDKGAKFIIKLKDMT